MLLAYFKVEPLVLVRGVVLKLSFLFFYSFQGEIFTIEPHEEDEMYFTIMENVSDQEEDSKDRAQNPPQNLPFQNLSGPFRTVDDCFNTSQPDQYNEGYNQWDTLSWSDNTSHSFQVKSKKKGKKASQAESYHMAGGDIAKKGGKNTVSARSYGQVLELPENVALKAPKSKIYTCEYCPKTFTNHSTRWEHRLTHTGQYPHRCTCCQPSKGFVRKRELVAHQTGMPVARGVKRKSDLVEYD